MIPLFVMDKEVIEPIKGMQSWWAKVLTAVGHREYPEHYPVASPSGEFWVDGVKLRTDLLCFDANGDFSWVDMSTVKMVGRP